MKTLVRLAYVVMVLLLVPMASYAQRPIRPGQYEVTIEMDLPREAQDAVFDAAGFHKQKRLECITPAQVTGDLSQILRREMDSAQCKLSDVKTTGSTMTFTTTCEEEGLRMVMRNEMTVTGDGFSGVTKATDQDGHVTTMKVAARRVGECGK